MMEYKEYFFIFFLIILSILIIYEILMYLRGKASEEWRSHPAIVSDISVRAHTDDEGVQVSKPYIKYGYTYKGKVYEGNRMFFGAIWSSNYSDSSREVCGININDEIIVYINPKIPSMSVFKKGYRGNILLRLGILITVLIMTLVSKS